MLRPARTVDVFELVDILVERHADSRYAGKVAIDEAFARKFLAQCIQRNGGTTDGGTYIAVYEKGGRIEAFVAAILSRIYYIGDKLGSSDLYLTGRRDADARALLALFNGYINWAESNPRVIEIGATWADTIPGSEAIMDLFTRKGFVPYAKSFRRECTQVEEALAA